MQHLWGKQESYSTDLTEENGCRKGAVDSGIAGRGGSAEHLSQEKKEVERRERGWIEIVQPIHLPSLKEGVDKAPRE